MSLSTFASPVVATADPEHVAQGDGDHVIPRDLLDRTWEYLATSSGAEVTSVRHGGGHKLPAEEVTRLRAWIEACLDLDGSR